MPKNYLEQILLYLEQLNDKDEVKEFLIKSKPYLEMDNIEYLNQIIDGINEYINTYSELDSNKDVISLENLKKICLDIMDEYKNMSEKEENEFPCLDGKGRFKVFFEGFSYGDFKSTI